MWGEGCSDEAWRGVMERLGRSKFRSRFRLRQAELRIVAEKGACALAGQCEALVRERLASAFPLRDGSQTPMRGHPCFVAQHATGCCCRTCLAKWHGIAPGRELSEDEIAYVTAVLMRWIQENSGAAADLPHTPDLF